MTICELVQKLLGGGGRQAGRRRYHDTTSLLYVTRESKLQIIHRGRASNIKSNSALKNTVKDVYFTVTIVSLSVKSIH
jgi:hypothetical protein